MAGFGSQEERALKLVEEGEKVLNKKGLFASVFGSNTQKMEDAAELFGKAANCYKVSRKWDDAGKLYMRTAGLHEKLGSAHEAASSYVEAGKCFKHNSPSDAVQSMTSAVTHYIEMGRFNQAARMLKDIGDMYDADGNYEDAKQCLQQAADYFAGENSTQSANACQVKVATIMSKNMDPPDFLGAAQIFEDLGRSCMETRLLQMNAKGYWLQAGLCYMASNDAVAARQKLAEFESVDYSFASSRECKFLSDLVTAMESCDTDEFAKAAFEYDKVSALDPWKTSVLLAIKRLISVEGGGVDGGDGEPDLT
ncbi:unnamed protein product [Chrysoparadoxa australica]